MNNECKGKELFDEMIEKEKQHGLHIEHWVQRFQTDLGCFPPFLIKEMIREKDTYIRKFLFFKKKIEGKYKETGNIIEKSIKVYFEKNNKSYHHEYGPLFHMEFGSCEISWQIEIPTPYNEEKVIFNFNYYPQIASKWFPYNETLDILVKHIFSRKDDMKK